MAVTGRMGGWADGRIGPVLVLAFGVLWVTVASAQEAPRVRPWPVQAARVVKWPSLVATTALLAFGVRASNDAQEIGDYATEMFLGYCKYNCARDASGNLDPQQMLAQNREYQGATAHATRLIVAGEVSLLATGALFLIDLIHRDEGPRNIPFTPFTIYATPRRLGLSLDFRSRRP